MSKNYKKKINAIVNRSIRKELDINKNAPIIKDKSAIVDDCLDLHGYRTLEAHGLVLDFLEHAKNNNFKIVRIITGKGIDGYSPLKSYIKDFLIENDYNYSQADMYSGGEGAFDIKV